MADRDFTIGSRNFKLNKIPAIKQYHIVRKVAPILSDMLPMLSKFSKMSSDELKEDQIEALAPVLNGFAKLSDVESEKLLIGLLSSVEMQQESGNWAKLANENGMMFDDLELPVMLQAAGRAFMFNMAGFFAALPQVSHGGK